MKFKDCVDFLVVGKNEFKVYLIYFGEGYMLIKIYCDMVDEGGGWIVRSIK